MELRKCVCCCDGGIRNRYNVIKFVVFITCLSFMTHFSLYSSTYFDKISIFQIKTIINKVNIGIPDFGNSTHPNFTEPANNEVTNPNTANYTEHVNFQNFTEADINDVTRRTTSHYKEHVPISPGKGPLESFLLRAESNNLNVFIMAPVTILPIQDGGLNITSLNQSDAVTLNQSKVVTSNQSKTVTSNQSIAVTLNQSIAVTPNQSKSVTFNQSKAVTLGMIGSENIKKDVFNEFKKDNFKVFILYVHSSIRLPSKYPSNKPFPSHVFCYHETSGLLLHLVIFYKRGDNFIWSDSVDLNPKNKPEWLSREQFTYGEYGASFNSINTEEVDVVFGNKTIKVHIPKNLQKFEANVRTSRHIECNYTRADEFYKLNKLEKKPSAWALKAVAILKLTEELLTAIGVRFVICSGSLLGWYRQCGVIPYTSDLDIEILHAEFKPEILKTLTKAGFSHWHTFGKVNEGYEYTVAKNGVKMDIFFIYEDGANYWAGGTEGKSKLRFIVPKYEMCWADLLEVRVRVPCNSLSYIEATYGSEWFKPKKSWNWSGDAKNIKRTGKWS